jgi:hypothetical protein
MPYITQGRRNDIEKKPTLCNLVASLGHSLANAGELNYVLTTIVAAYITKQGTRYSAINDAVGALECAKLELYRRVAAPYEEIKRAENGDVYPEEILTRE